MKKNNVKITLEKGKSQLKKNTIYLEGDLILQNIEKIWEKLQEELFKSEAFIIELQNVDNIDLSCLQLLSSIQKYNRKVIIRMTLSAHLEGLLERGGFSALLN